MKNSIFNFLKSFYHKITILLKNCINLFFKFPLKRYLANTALVIILGCLPPCIFVLIVDFYVMEPLTFTQFFEDEELMDNLKLCYFFLLKLSLFLHILLAISILYYDYLYKNIYELYFFKSNFVQQLLCCFFLILVIAIYLF